MRFDNRQERDQWSYTNARRKWLHQDRAFGLAMHIADRLLLEDPALIDSPTLLQAQVRYAVMHVVRLAEHWRDGMPEFAQRPEWLMSERLKLAYMGESEAPQLGALPDSWAWLHPRQYLEEIGLLRQGQVSAAGKMFLQLTGLDAVRWLLINEKIRSVADESATCITRSVANWLLHGDEVKRPATEAEIDNDRHIWQFQGPRLHDLGVVKISLGDKGLPQLQVQQPGQPILREIVSDANTPMTELARALHADILASAMASIDAAGVTAASRTVEGEQVRQAAMMKHELRNKLTPAANQLDVLQRSQAAVSEWDRDSIQIAAQAVADALTYVDKMVTYTNALTADAAWFPAAGAVRDGVRQGRNGNRTATISLVDALDEWDIHGLREELVVVVANLVRNALQAGATRVDIDVLAQGPTAGLALAVHDNGPGVPTPDRQRIFERGYSGRQGTGDGLWLARGTMQRQFGGNIVYLDRRSGGATFAVHVPATKVRRSTDEAETQ